MANTMQATRLPKYTGDALGGLVLARIDDELLIVAEADLADGRWSWHDAIEMLNGTGWHLPSRLELSFISARNELIPGLEFDEWYWSGDSYSASYAWLQNTSGSFAGNQASDFKSGTYYVRPVRRVATLDFDLSKGERSEPETTSLHRMADALEALVETIGHHIQRGHLNAQKLGTGRTSAYVLTADEVERFASERAA